MLYIFIGMFYDDDDQSSDVIDWHDSIVMNSECDSMITDNWPDHMVLYNLAQLHSHEHST